MSYDGNKSTHIIFWNRQDWNSVSSESNFPSLVDHQPVAGTNGVDARSFADSTTTRGRLLGMIPNNLDTNGDRDVILRWWGGTPSGGVTGDISWLHVFKVPNNGNFNNASASAINFYDGETTLSSGTAGYVLKSEASVAASHSIFVPGEIFMIDFHRYGSDGLDTLTTSFRVIGVSIEFPVF